MFVRMLSHSLVDRAHCGTGTTSMQTLDVLFVQVPSSHVLVSTTIASFTRRHTITLCSEMHPKTGSDLLSAICRFLASFNLLAWFVEILCCVIGCAEGRAVEVVEHQVHVLSLLVLKIVSDFDVSMHLNFDVSICLPRQGPRLSEATLVHQLLVGVVLLATRAVPNDSLHLA